MKKILICVGTRPNFIKITQFKKIAKTKMEDLNTDNADSAERMVAGTARSMGIRVE